MRRLYTLLAESYIVVMIAALLLGLFVPAMRELVPWNIYFLQVIFFLSCLKIDARQMGGFLQDWKFLTVANVIMLVGLPLLVWLVVNPFAPTMGLALFLLAAMPVGMTAPLLVEVVGGKQSIAIVLTMTTSLLAPFSIPLLTKWLYGTTVTVDMLAMFTQLVLVIVVPFILALFVRKLSPTIVANSKMLTKPISIILLGLLIASAVAQQADRIMEWSQEGWNVVFTIAALYAFFLLLHLIGYYSFWWKSRGERNAASVSLTYMNFTLAIFLATQFFPTSGILLPLVLSILPWATLLPIWQRIIRKAAL